MTFDVLGGIEQVETIAAGPGVKVRSYLRKTYGKRDLKIKNYLDKP